MKMEKQIFRMFVVGMIVASIALGVLYSALTYRNLRNEEYETLVQAANLTEKQLESMVDQAENVSLMILSDPNALTAIKTLAKNDRPAFRVGQILYFTEEYEAIRKMVTSYFLQKNYYRTVFFNEWGDKVYGNNSGERAVDTNVSVDEVPGVEGLRQGKYTLVGVHKDEWGKGHKNDVFSMVKRLVGTGMGYIEVQWLKSDMDRQMLTRYGEYQVTLYNPEGELLYNSDSNSLDERDAVVEGVLKEHLGEKMVGAVYAGQGKMMAYSWNDSVNGYIVLAKDSDIASRIFYQLIPSLTLILAVFLFAGFLYSRYSAKKLVRPIRSLRHIMEKTELDNMTNLSQKDSKAISETEEIQALLNSYNDLMERLSDSMQREQKLSVMQLSAQMDLLQAQVNPHFIYNVLNVISAKGIMANDESICDICTNLGQMLRYSTNTKEKMGTIRQEKEYLQIYFNLLKYRYEHRLDYEITIDERILDEKMPKIVLQQIVENSVTHGYSEKSGTMKIRVTGFLLELSEDRKGWMLNVHDDGSGFDQARKAEIVQQFEEMRRRLSTEREHVEMEIGGFGLVNTYARLYLVYGERMSMEIQTGDNGTDVRILVNES